MLYAPYDPGASAIWIELHLHPISNEHFNSVQTHFAGKVRQNDALISKLYAKEGVGKSLINDSFCNNGFRHICVGHNSNKWGCSQAEPIDLRLDSLLVH